MNIFKTFTLKWWQAGLFKIGVLGLGIIVGTHWHTIFHGNLWPILGVSAICLIYVTSVWWKQ